MPVLDASKPRVRQGFEKAGFPGCAGIIDVVKIPIVVSTPTLRAGRRHAFADRKGNICLSYQFIVDSEYRILDVSGGLKGTVSDVIVWNRSTVRENMGVFLRANEWIMADMGYPLRPYMLSGYRKPELDTSPYFVGRTYFNTVFSGTRNTIERVFGISKARFPILTGMWFRNQNDYSPVVLACAILHNVCLDARDQWDEVEVVGAIRKNSRLRKRENKKLKRDAKLNRLPVAKHGGGLLKGRFKRHALALHLGAAVGPAPADGEVLVDSDSD